jgi:hypothetical protein
MPLDNRPSVLFMFSDGAGFFAGLAGPILSMF